MGVALMSRAMDSSSPRPLDFGREGGLGSTGVDGLREEVEHDAATQTPRRALGPARRRCSTILKRDAPRRGARARAVARADPVRGHAAAHRASACRRRWSRPASCKLHYPFIAREMPPAHQLYKGLPGIHVTAINLSEEESRRDRRRRRAAARDHDPANPHARPAVHLRQPQELPAEVRAARLRGRSTRSSPCRRQWERVAAFGDAHGGGQQGELLPVPHRADPVEGAAAADRARGVLAAEGRVPGGRRLQGHGARLPRAGAAAARAPRRRGRARSSARAFLEWLQDDNYIFMGTRVLLGRRPTGRSQRARRDRDRRLHRPHAAAGGVPGRRRARRGAPAPAAAATTGSSTSTSAPTPPRSTTSSRSRT